MINRIARRFIPSEDSIVVLTAYALIVGSGWLLAQTLPAAVRTTAEHALWIVGVVALVGFVMHLKTVFDQHILAAWRRLKEPPHERGGPGGGYENHPSVRN